MDDEPSNPCCLNWKEKYAKLKEKNTKLEGGRNALKQGISLYQQQIDRVEKEKEGLMKAYQDEKTRADNEKENKDKECALRVTLEAEIATLKSEIISLNQHGGQVPEEVSRELECLRCRVSERDMEINQIKDLLEKEKTRANVEITKAQKEKKKAVEAAKKVQVPEDVSQELESLRCRVSESDSEINRIKDLLEKEKTRADVEITKAQKEKKRAEESAKKVQGEKGKVNDLKKVAEMEKKRAEELKLQVEALQSDAEEAKSNLTLETERLKEAKNMLRVEKEKTDVERKRFELQMAKVEEQRKVAESNLKQAMTEKNRANHMSEQLDKATRRLKELEKELMDERIKLTPAGNQLNGEITNEASMKEINEKEAHKKLEKVTQKLKKEKRRAEYERKKAEEQRQLAEKHKKASMEVKNHADQLDCELLYYKQRVEEMGKEIQKLHLPTALLESSFSYPSSGSLQTAEMKILKKQLKLEKIRLKQAKQIAKVETGRNQLLRQETLLLRQDLSKYSQRLDTLDSYLLRSYGGIDEPEKLQSLRLQREHIGVEACERNLHANGLANTSATSSGTALSALLEVEPIVSGGLSGGTIKGNNENLASMNVNIDGSRTVQTARKTRKRLRDAHEPNFVDHSLQQQVFEKSSSQGILNHQTDKIPYENKLVVAHGDSSLMIYQSKNHKKMKSASCNTPALVDLSAADELKAKPDNLVLKQHNLCISAPTEMDNLTALTQVGIDVLGEDGSRNQHRSGDFDEIDILKLLDLDNDGYEERYRKAIQRPLSPTLPQIEFKSSETPELCNPTYLSMEKSYEGVSNRKEDLESYCSFDVMNLEIDSNTKDSSLPVTTHLSNGISENLHKNDNNDQNAVSFISLPLKCCMVTGSMVSDEQNQIVHTGNEDASVCGVFLKYCVIVSENTENRSMCRRVYIATSGCLTELLSSESTFLQNVLPSIWKSDDLTAKERVSVFFSLLLHYISDVAKADLKETTDLESVQLLKSYGQQICSVLSDASSRRLLMQLDVQELFFLIEDFLLNGKIVTNDFLFKETTVDTDISLSLSIQEASIPLLLAGGVVLSSVCAATGQIGFLCEVSVNILRIQLLKSWVIKLLHIFAYICGTNYLELEDRSLEISVLKCLVVLSEKMNSPKHSSCANCPFANGVASVDDMAVPILDKLQVYASSGTTLNMLNGGHLSNGVLNEASSSVNGHSSLFCLDEDMVHCVDILSLLELVACFMSWEWTCSNVVAPLVKILEASVNEHLLSSVITLLGQLGRLGIDAKGYSDSGVEKLRDWLCNRLSRSYTSEFGLYYQFAVATGLVGLIETPFEEIIGSDSDQPVGVTSQSLSATSSKKCIREWFSSLNAEQVSSLRLLLASYSSKCKLEVWF